MFNLTSGLWAGLHDGLGFTDIVLYQAKFYRNIDLIDDMGPRGGGGGEGGHDI